MAKQNKAIKQRLSAGKTNAAGYAKRQLRNSQKLNHLSEVYEHQQEKVKRSKVALDLDKDEAATFSGRRGGDGESGGESEVGELRARLLGETVDDEKLDSQDDEEIDSDAAFEDSDEDRFAGFNFSSSKASKRKVLAKKRQSITKTVRFADVDLDEGDAIQDHPHSEMEEELSEADQSGDEFIDVLDVLDGRGEPEVGSDSGSAVEGVKTPANRTLSRNRDGESEERRESEGSSGESDDDDDSQPEQEQDPELSASEAGDVPEALDELANFISNLDDSKKRKSPDDSHDVTHADGDNPPPRKRRAIAERTEVGMENEFHAQSSGKKLDLDDLLAPLASHSSNLLSLKKSTKILASSSSAKALSAPLPQRTQERFDREAAYEQTKEEVDKWSATMKRIKEAEHLSFPLQAQSTGRTSNLELVAKFIPTTELETSVDKLLKMAKLREEDIVQTEELKMNHLSVEEVAARRAELRKMRELLFRSEVKAKRLAKIKSKAYRRLRKKEKVKLAEKIDGELDEDDEEVRMKREVERAKERATLRHKHTGKWAKAMRGKHDLDVDQRQEISAMLERGERLRAKIRGERSSGDETGEDGDDSDGDGDGVDAIKAAALKAISQFGEDDPVASEPTNGKGQSVFDMKFMKEGMARESERANRMVDDFMEEMGGGADDDVESDPPQAAQKGPAVERKGGRISYHPGDKPQIRSTHTPNTETPTIPTSAQVAVEPSPEPATPSESVSAAKESNPWLTNSSARKTPRRKNEILVDKNSASIEKSKNRLRKQARKREEEKDKARDDAVVEISMSNVMALSSSAETPLPSTVPRDNNVREPSKQTGDDDPDHNSEVEEQEKVLSRGKSKGLKAFQQRDLVALAFAGDNVVQEFEAAKRQEMVADAPHELDTTLPGWGSWGGTGTRRQPPKPHLIKKIAGVDPKSRADFGKSNIIISEKRDKKAAKYLVKDLPYPYTSKAQFERSMDMPLGTEWNTRVGFQRGTLPKVVKKMGKIIDPLEKLF